MSQVVVIGTGYVGLNTAAALAYLGHDVVGIDTDEKKVAMLKAKRAPIQEEGLDALLAMDNLPLRFSTRLADGMENVDVIFIAVGTPSSDDGQANLDYVYAASAEIAETLKGDKAVTIVVKSTVPIGVNEDVEKRIRQRAIERGLGDAFLHFASNPEFLREGKALSDTFYPDRILIGTEDDASYDTLAALYSRILERDFAHPTFLEPLSDPPVSQIMRCDRVSAEMIKYASNAFLAVKISYINEIAKLCERVGANINDVSVGMGLDRRIAPAFLKAGLGWGGSCFPKDTLALLSLASDYRCELPIIQAARDINAGQIELVIAKIQRELLVLRGKRIALLGVSFKPLTDDVRNSPAVDLALQLRALGAEVCMHDPVGVPNAREIYADSGLQFFDDVEDAMRDASCSVLVTDWAQYRALDYAALSGIVERALIIDARNLLSRASLEQAGWQYLGIGR